MHRPALVYLLVLIGLAALLAAPYRACAQDAEPAVEVVSADLGWGRVIRPGRWNLASARLRARAVTPVTLEWYVPRPGQAAMVIRQKAVINPRAGTYVMLVPVGPDAEAITLRVAEEETGRTLAWWPETLRVPGAFNRRIVEAEGETGVAFVGIAGDSNGFGWLNPTARSGLREVEQLPPVAAAYDALDVLLLNNVDLSRLDVAVQAAIAQWVRGGGELWLSLPTGGLPSRDDSPIAALLDGAGPAEQLQTLQIDQGRVRWLPRELSDADRESLQAAAAEAFSRSLGGVTSETRLVNPPPPRQPWPLLGVLMIVGPIDLIILLLAGRPGKVRLLFPILGTIGLVTAAALLVDWDAEDAAEPAPPAWRLWEGAKDGGMIDEIEVRLTSDGVTVDEE